MRTFLFSTLLAVVLASQAFAATNTVQVKINGLVCDFCARSMEKLFGKRDEVAGIAVNLDTKLVTINLKDGKTIDDATITQLITDAGYSVEGITHE